MNSKEAKDFIVQEAVVQASLESVSLSDLERRMMYFVENDPFSCKDPLTLNDEFEAQYDTDEYEAKLGLLLQHAYERLKKENPEKIPQWNQAFQILSEGDHYLPVMWRNSPVLWHSSPAAAASPSVSNRVVLWVVGLLVAMVLVALAFVASK